ncbi:MAG: beta-ketoacyl synthase N-terminal-like domain-containing protein [Bacteroidales bacterium]|jgi:nodulation protein E|nr:beta-ketoacyl synthase N-terminal-like domain-containing protein [Bacteroidales bacterium]
MQDKKTVVVTGIGVHTSIGSTRDDFWKALIAGKYGIKRIKSFDPTGHKSQIASELLSYNPDDYFDRKEKRKMARVSQLATSAAIEAVKDAGLDMDNEDRTRIGCVIGVGGGDYTHFEEQHIRFLKMGPGSVNPLTVPRIIPNMPVSSAAMHLGIHGPTFGVSAACTTGTHTIGIALGMLRAGMADVILAGGAESALTPLVIDAYGIAAPEPNGTWAAAAMVNAVKDADLTLEDIGYVNAHGTSTKMNDKTETLAIQKAFNNRDIPVSSNKSMIGHALGAAGAIEAAATVLSIYHGILPPTINYESKDPECNIDVVPNVARRVDIKAAISNSFGFGGQNGVLAFSKF